MSRSLRTLCVFLALVASPALGQSRADALRDLEFRPIGPANMGGRVTDVDGIPGDHRIFYVSGADGGIFKTTNGGVTFDEIFNDQPVYSIGALHLAPSDSNVLWVGTGEGDPRNSVSYGNGVYVSRNGGMTWEHVGLDDSERIKRIAVHPADPDLAYVCALGHEWGPNEERGVFRTTDGGRTWDKVLYIDQDTGCSDLDMDLTNPRILYAGMWTHRRRPWRFDGGGRATAAYRTLDGGDTWEKLDVTDAPMSRIGIQVAPSQPNTVYLIAEIPDLQGSFWRSDDYGETWRVVNTDPNVNFRPFYYSDIRVDPNDPETIYSLSGGLMKSTDGGRTFDRIGGGVHGDHQSFWIDPLDSDRIIKRVGRGLPAVMGRRPHLRHHQQRDTLAVLPDLRRRPGPLLGVWRPPGQRTLVWTVQLPGAPGDPQGSLVHLRRWRRLLRRARARPAGAALLGEPGREHPDLQHGDRDQPADPSLPEDRRLGG
jgi:photosystem II stability/assembly factor-like uncharacterized protein